MKMFIPLLCMLSFTIAEPPVPDSYASARSSHDHHSDVQRSPSQQYGPPSHLSHRNSLNEFGSRSRTSAKLSSSYGPPKAKISEEYGVPNARNSQKNSQEYGTPATRNSPSQTYGVPTSRNSPSQKYGVPSSRSSSFQEYGISSRSSPSQEYGVPSHNSPSQEYGLPKSLSAPSEDYGVPSANQDYGRSAPSQEYGVPSTRSHHPSSLSRNIESSSTLYGAPRKISEEYGTPERTLSKAKKPSTKYLPQSKSSFGKSGVFSSTKGSQTYGAPKSSLSTSYGLPSPTADYSQEFNDFGAKDLSDTYGVPSLSLSQEYGAPKTGLKTDAVASSYSSAKSSPSSSYEVSSARDAIPSDQYGIPEHSSRSDQGYDYSRTSEEDYQEPVHYDFAYKVNDFITGSDFGHQEARQENRAEGSYFVVLPDGNKQVVEYEADERGFKPRISVEPVENARAGYDENAADLTDSEGPY